jgi:hypothetical protein
MIPSAYFLLKITYTRTVFRKGRLALSSFCEVVETCETLKDIFAKSDSCEPNDSGEKIAKQDSLIGFEVGTQRAQGG